MQDIIISAIITIFSIGLLIVSLASYSKYKNKKLLFVSGVFCIFFIKGLLLTLGLFDFQWDIFQTVVNNGLLDLFILILLFGATLKR